MKLEFHLAEQAYAVNLAAPIDLAIALHFNGAQPCFFEAPAATAQPFASGGFIGDTQQGGSSNVATVTLTPHCNGTHTECVGHLANQRISLESVLREAFIPATLITVTPQPAAACRDTYLPPIQKEDLLITHDQLSSALPRNAGAFLRGLILRTLPNAPAKTTRRYAQQLPAYFSIEAMQLVTRLGVQHLLVDLPSVDRTFDEGRLTSHRLFWDVPPESHDVDPTRHSVKTITEMIYVDTAVPDGFYLLNLQIPRFVAEAAPSRPLIFAVTAK